MTQNNNLTTQQIHRFPLGKLMLIGAGVGLIIIATFLYGVPTRPEWPTYWMIRPLVVVPFAGAMGGLSYYILDVLRYQGGWKRIAANILSFLVIVIGFWMGIVLGLAGTLWH